MDSTDDDFLSSSSRDNELIKQPFKRLKFALIQVTKTAIPFHVQLLKDQTKNIELSKLENNQLQLHSEQIKAANTVRLLKSDLHQLEKINVQVKDEDCELFQQEIEDPTRDVIEVLSEFMELHSEVLQPLPDIEDSGENFDFNNTKLVCDFKQDSSTSDLLPFTPFSADCQCETVESGKVLKHWLRLKKELFEVNELIRKFAALVFSQKTQVTTLDDNILNTRENVVEGTKQLRKAVIFKSATIPLAGAVIGGILLGPIGALAGFKIFGTAVCAAGGGILGYSAGYKVKKKKLETLDIEMKALTYPSKTLSLSTPELSLAAEVVPDRNADCKED